MKNLLEAINTWLIITVIVAFAFGLPIALVSMANPIQADEQNAIDEMLDRAVEMGEWFTIILRHGGGYSSNHVSVRGDEYVCLDQFHSEIEHYGIGEPSTFTYTRIGEACVLRDDIVGIQFLINR